MIIDDDIELLENVLKGLRIEGLNDFPVTTKSGRLFYHTLLKILAYWDGQKFQRIATEDYVQTKLLGLIWKDAVQGYSVSTNIVISTLDDGVVVNSTTLHTGDRVLLMGQTTGSENGIYIVGTKIRSTDMTLPKDFNNAIVPVPGGGCYRCNTTNPNVGSTTIVFVPFTVAGADVTGKYDKVGGTISGSVVIEVDPVDGEQVQFLKMKVKGNDNVYLQLQSATKVNGSVLFSDNAVVDLTNTTTGVVRDASGRWFSLLTNEVGNDNAILQTPAVMWDVRNLLNDVSARKILFGFGSLNVPYLLIRGDKLAEITDGLVIDKHTLVTTLIDGLVERDSITGKLMFTNNAERKQIGDLVKPETATAGQVLKFNGTDWVAGDISSTIFESDVTMTPRVIQSGTNLGANADIIESILGGGTTGQVLKSIGDGTTPTWQNESGGGGADSRKSRVAYNTIMNSNY